MDSLGETLVEREGGWFMPIIYGLLLTLGDYGIQWYMYLHLLLSRINFMLILYFNDLHVHETILMYKNWLNWWDFGQWSLFYPSVLAGKFFTLKLSYIASTQFYLWLTFDSGQKGKTRDHPPHFGDLKYIVWFWLQCLLYTLTFRMIFKIGSIIKRTDISTNAKRILI